MSGKVGGGGGSVGARKGSTGISDIPSGSRKVVQSLKEIVNCPEAEIYAMLKECNMDPNEAVNRLLSQDPFHEVKSKKDKKKENKDTTESRPRANNPYNRGVRGGSDRYAGRSAATHFSSSESGNYAGKSSNKRDNGTQSYAASASASGVVARPQPSYSDYVAVESKTSSVALGDGNSISSSQSASGHQPAWFGASGQMSMADIVKMGRPQNKSNVDIRSKVYSEREVNANQRVPFKDEWPSIEKPIVASSAYVTNPAAESDLGTEPSEFEHLKAQVEETHLPENGSCGNHGVDQVRPDSVSGRNVQEDDSGVSSGFDDNPYKQAMHNHSAEHESDEDEDDDASSVAANLQHLNIENDEQEVSHEEERPVVIIPDHLQVHAPECSQLSFGSFGSFGSRPLSSNVDETSDAAPPQLDHSDSRNTGFYDDDHLGNASSNGNIVPSGGNYEASESQQEIMMQENSEAAQENHQYTYAQQEQGYAYENSKQQQMNAAAFDDSQTNSQMPNLASLSNVMQGYTNSVPNALLGQSGQSVRELELQYSPFPMAQSLPSRNSGNPSSLSGQTISMPEGMRGSGISATQTTQQTIAAVPQQLPMHPYGQPTMPLTHFPNMISYPLLPQSYPYMPSPAFQQPFPANSSYHQSLAALLPQYKNTLSPPNLPPSASPSPASPYGFGNSSSIGSGNFPMNRPGYEDVSSSQYKESAHLLSLQRQQNENSPMWLHGPGSRTMSAVPTNAYYNLQAQQNQQAPGFLRQAQQQQASQHYGSAGYNPNFYQSQAGISMDHQQQNPRDGGGALGGSHSQGQPSKQIWQNTY